MRSFLALLCVAFRENGRIRRDIGRLSLLSRIYCKERGGRNEAF